MNDVLKKILLWAPSHIGVLLLGAGLVFFLAYKPVLGKLGNARSELQSVERSMADSKAIVGLLTQSNSDVQRKLADANKLVAGQRSTIADQQRTIEKQRGLLDQQQQDLNNIASTVTGSGGGIEATARTIKRLVDELFAVYHKTP